MRPRSTAAAAAAAAAAADTNADADASANKATKIRADRDSWASRVVARARTANKAARKHSASREALGRGVRGADGSDEQVDPDAVSGPALATFSDARRTASAIADRAAVEAAVARASLLFAMSAGADLEYHNRRMTDATSGAVEALRFAASVEKAALTATAKTAAAAAGAALAATLKRADIIESRTILGETTDGERSKRLVIEIARMEREMADDVATFRVYLTSPVFTMVDDFGLDAAKEKLSASARGLDRRGSDEESRQRGGASVAPAVFPPFHYHLGGDQLQWPFPAGS